MHGRFVVSMILLLLWLTSVQSGFERDSPDIDNNGKIQGTVVWEGPLPTVPSLAGNVPVAPVGSVEHVLKPNPNAPLIDDATRGVRDVVVFLRAVNETPSWNLPAVRVEQHDMELRIRQGEVSSRVGFVKAGESISIVSRDKRFHSLRARGAAFFSLPFVQQDQPTTRKLPKKGLVELSSGAGYIWMQAYLFVDDHPYYARTTSDGRFTLRYVPAGNYELVCWIPNWHIARRELDPESSQPSRIRFHPPAEILRQVSVRADESAFVNFAVSEKLFKK